MTALPTTRNAPGRSDRYPRRPDRDESFIAEWRVMGEYLDGTLEDVTDWLPSHRQAAIVITEARGATPPLGGFSSMFIEARWTTEPERVKG
jgi:hypothetical protein